MLLICHDVNNLFYINISYDNVYIYFNFNKAFAHVNPYPKLIS